MSTVTRSWIKRPMVGVLLIGIGMLFFSQCPAYDVIQSQRARSRLLCKTSYQDLRDAGRAILSQVAAGKLRFGDHAVRGRRSFPNGLALPRAVIDLNPRVVRIVEDGYVMIEMHGGMDSFGVKVYPDKYLPPFVGFPLGDRELMDGLWYYDGEYKWPGYAERIDRMLQQRRRD